jgi:glutaredoxin-related protein
LAASDKIAMRMFAVAQVSSRLGVGFKAIDRLGDLAPRQGIKAFSAWPTRQDNGHTLTASTV